MGLRAQMSLGEDSTTNPDQDKRWRHRSMVSSQRLRERGRGSHSGLSESWLGCNSGSWRPMGNFFVCMKNHFQLRSSHGNSTFLCSREHSISSSDLCFFSVRKDSHMRMFTTEGFRKSQRHPVCQCRAHTCGNLRPSSNSSGTRALKFQVGRQIAVHAL